MAKKKIKVKDDLNVNWTPYHMARGSLLPPAEDIVHAGDDEYSDMAVATSRQVRQMYIEDNLGVADRLLIVCPRCNGYTLSAWMSLRNQHTGGRCSQCNFNWQE